MRTTIVVPIYCEGERAVSTIRKILRESRCPVIAVNDGSTDDSEQLLKKEFGRNERVTVASHVFNLGKGAAMKTGAELAWSLGAEAVIFIDADGQHNPSHLGLFEKALERESIVFGYRELGSNVPLIRKYGNKLASFLVERLYGIRRRDLLCGFMGFRRSVYKKIGWSSPRYGVETEIATKVGKKKLFFSEIKVDTIYLDKYKGVSVVDALKILIKIPGWYF